MWLTEHFKDRVFERYGINLTKEEIKEIAKAVKQTKNNVPFENNEKFLIILHNRNIRFTAIYKNEKLVTAHSNKKMSWRKFLKRCSSGNTKKT